MTTKMVFSILLGGILMQVTQTEATTLKTMAKPAALIDRTAALEAQVRILEDQVDRLSTQLKQFHDPEKNAITAKSIQTENIIAREAVHTSRLHIGGKRSAGTTELYQHGMRGLAIKLPDKHEYIFHAHINENGSVNPRVSYFHWWTRTKEQVIHAFEQN